MEPKKEETQVSIYEMGQAEETQIPEFIQVIQERIDWMESRGMKQWNDEEYLDFYSEEYFRAQARAGHLFFLIKEGRAAGVTALLEEDDRWEDGSREYFYVHHLASRTGIPGAGSAFLGLIEDYARKQGKRGIRLDCQLGNEPLLRKKRLCHCGRAVYSRRLHWNQKGAGVLENDVAKRERVSYNKNRLRKFPLLQTATTVKNYRRNTRGKRDDYCTGFWRPV